MSPVDQCRTRRCCYPGVAQGCSLVAPGSSILFIASIAAHIGVAEWGAYSRPGRSDRHVRCLAMEVVKRNIQVNCLSPSLVETLLDAATRTVGFDGRSAQQPPTMGFGKPEDIAIAAIFMLSDASRWVTGTTLVMDGDLTIS
ncbi:SDR family NAD(P)-dependent oxidoreductase [Pseudomonas aeruginosa]|nr:SDR family NAD(P)-dependent oxidoreductase [Pseudomonas aeruginosa]